MCKNLETIKGINNGESLKKIALEFEVCETTVGDWRRNKAQIEAFCSKMDSSKTFEERSTLKKAKTEKLDEAVYLWFEQQRTQGIPISGNILKEKALLLRQKLNENESFSASQGWLDKFKKRHGIRQLAIAREKLSVIKDSAKDFVERFEEMIEKENLTLDQIYIADKTGLFYRMMPSKSLASKEEASAPGYKKRTRVLRTISHVEGVQTLTTTLKYLEQRSDVTLIDLLLLKNWRDRAATDRNSGLLQRKVTDYFKK
ncbi:Jerky -like [Araneus ventricosus]|uniref:Jerky-like n=1 Tax=Araneus ventricosus TaxID=182803 RepID=A0A4Y2QE70_ARAVE|nr:Jerky -like [Araneus ventricosus]